MSIKVMTAVWQHSQARSGDLLVQLALADFSNDEGFAFPAIPTLGRKARLSPRQVKRALDRLQRLGELTVFKKQGPHGVNRYRIMVGDNFSLAQPVNGSDGDRLSLAEHVAVTLKASDGDILGKEVVTPTSPNPLKNPSKIRKKEEKRSGGPVGTVDEGDNSVVGRDDHGEVAMVGEGAKDRMDPLVNPLNFLSPGLRESFSKHFEDDPS